MKKIVLALFALFVFASCAKDPFDGMVIADGWVYETSHRGSFDFATARTFSMPDSILMIRSSNSFKLDTLTARSQKVLNLFRDSLVGRGFVEVASGEPADLQFGIAAANFLELSVVFDPGIWNRYGYYYWPYSPTYIATYSIQQAYFVSLQRHAGYVPEGVWTATLRGSYVFEDIAIAPFVAAAFKQSPYLKTN